ncbi:acylneuraminate cytidylyltransferase family protein [Candidatus Albibeggiatoa sp. nov. BB20]|uniref:acylneuraminate cytidylyltransferase family protein n=1 Tax=Candidatus Albibeggiatoa sp. nov. BB20 TaxID=3162723 RepID=UPI003365443B
MNSDSKKIIALLPMKANSERVKGKNFRDFCGKPLFRWILDTLLAVKAIDSVVINTDARHILAENDLVESERVIIRDRKPEICGDMVSMNKILTDDINNIDADTYLMTHVTNPLISSKTIEQALTQFIQAQKNNQADSLFTVNKIQTRFYHADGSAVNHDPDNLIRTQDLEPWFEENSNLYIFTKQSFATTNARIGQNPTMYTMSKFESIDIDEPEDWEMAEIAARYFLQKEATK